MKHTREPTSLILGCAAVLFLGSSVFGEAPSAKLGSKSEPDVVLYEGTYPGWPWITAAADGTLYCVFREGTEHGFSASGKAMMVKSTDHGKTWSEAAVVVDDPGVDDRNVAITELPNHDLLVTYNTYLQVSVDPWKTVSQAKFVRSSDGGKSWSEPQSGPLPNTQTRSAVHVMADGTLIWPMYIAPNLGAVAGISKDDGQTWEAVRVPDSPVFTGDEWDVQEVEPGRLVGIMRNAHRKPFNTYQFKTESRDGGRTWEVPEQTNLHVKVAHAPANIFLQNDKPTVIYPDRRRISVSAAKSSDPALLNWDVEHQLACYRYNADESQIPDGSYAVSAPTGPHQRLIVDYEIRPESKRITGYFVDFPEDW
ncbi:sialidase family protein [Planctomicrobium sp. SH661]|uniref:sialidase family protein n=1 Tax=Planctomicrobium sp. SH661 TaxID=3448124 RepID=UPI003F5BAF6D